MPSLYRLIGKTKFIHCLTCNKTPYTWSGCLKIFFFNVYTTCPIYDFKHVKMYYNNFSGTKIWLGRSEQFIKFSNYFFFFFPCVLAECFYINKITKILWKKFFCSSFSFCTVLLFLISLPKLP